MTSDLIKFHACIFIFHMTCTRSFLTDGKSSSNICLISCYCFFLNYARYKRGAAYECSEKIVRDNPKS